MIKKNVIACFKLFLNWPAPSLLVVIATTQIFLSTFYHLTPWKGGGFGMFSTTYSTTSRSLSCETIDQYYKNMYCFIHFRGNGRLGPLTYKKGEELMAFPTPRGLSLVVDDYLSYHPQKNVVQLNEEYRRKLLLDGIEPEGDTVLLKSIKLSVWQLEFDHIKHTVWMQPLPIEYQRNFEGKNQK